MAASTRREKSKAGGQIGKDAFCGQAGLKLIRHGAYIDHGQLAIERLDRCAHLAQDGAGLGRGMHLDDHVTCVGLLLIRDIKNWRSLGTQIGVAGICCDADDLDRAIRVIGVRFEYLADRILPREEPSGKSLVHHGHGGSRRRVVCGKCATLQKRNAHGAKEIRTHAVDLHTFLIGLGRAPWQMKGCARMAVANDRDIAQGNGSNAWE